MSITAAKLRLDRLSVARKAGFTLADFACNLYWPSLTIFLLYYYTDVVESAQRRPGSST